MVIIVSQIILRENGVLSVSLLAIVAELDLSKQLTLVCNGKITETCLM